MEICDKRLLPEQVIFDDVCFISDQHAYLDFYISNSLKQQSAGGHVAHSWHIYTDLKPTSLNAKCLVENHQRPIVYS